MTTSVSKPALNLREKLTQLQHLLSNTKPNLVRLPQFKNLVTNGGFDSDTAWTKGTGWTISGGKANFNSAANNGTASSFSYNSPIVLDPAKAFSFAVTFSDVVDMQYRDFYAFLPGNGESSLGDGYTSTPVLAGEERKLILPDDTSTLLSFKVNTNVGANHTFALDDMSIWEADPADGEPWLRLPHGFKVNGRGGQVFRDGLLLSLDAYEEITVLGQTWIKPMTAPGPNTAFDIWAGV